MKKIRSSWFSFQYMVWRASLFVLLHVFMAPILFAEDWPQWMGMRRDGTWMETNTMTVFPKDGLKPLWRQPIGAGFSGPAVADGRVFVTDFMLRDGVLTNNASAKDSVQGQERLLAFDEVTGALLWTYAYDMTVQVSYASGPRTTPTVVGDQVFILGTAGHLAALNTATGEKIWSVDLPEAYQTPVPMWGYSNHLLVVKNLVISLVGGEGSTVVAFDRKSGKEQWRALTSAEPGYCPPVLVDVGGQQQVLVWDSEALSGLEPNTGRVLWTTPLPANFGMSVTAPQRYEDALFVSGIGTVPTMYTWQDGKDAPEVLWRAEDGRALVTGNSTPILDQGLVYGVDTRGYLTAVDIQTGNRLWSTLKPTTGKRPARYATAFLVKNHDHYYLFNEQGYLIAAHLSKDGYFELGRTRLIEPTLTTYGRKLLWMHPAFANGAVIVRNDREIIRYALKHEKKTQLGLRHD